MINYCFVVNDIMRVEQESLYIKYKEEIIRVRLLVFAFLVIIPIMFAVIYFGSSIPSVYFHHKWGERGIGYFPSVVLCFAYYWFMGWYQNRYVQKLKKVLIPCGCAFLKKYPNGIDRMVSFYEDGNVNITDDGVNTILNLSDCKRAVFGKELVLFLPRDTVNMLPFCVSCVDTLNLYNAIKRQIKCTTFSLQRKKEE